MKEEEEEKGHRTWVGDGKKGMDIIVMYTHCTGISAKWNVILVFSLSVTLPGRAHIEDPPRRKTKRW